MSCRLVGPSLVHSISPPATPTTGEKRIQKETAGQGCRGIRGSSQGAAVHATEGSDVTKLNSLQRIMDVTGFKHVTVANGATERLGLHLSNGLQTIVGVTGVNGLLNPEGMR